jgi:hypothetical protein
MTPNQVLNLSFLIKQSPTGRNVPRNQPKRQVISKRRADASQISMFLFSQSKQKKRQYEEINPCSLLFSVLLPFHDVNISKSSHVNLNQQAKKRSYRVKMRMREIVRQRKENDISKGATANGSKVRLTVPVQGEIQMRKERYHRSWRR